MIFNRKIEILFEPKDQLILDGQSKICNWLYNKLLELTNQEFEIKKKEAELLKGRNLRDLVPKLKQINKFLESVYSSPLKNVAFRLKNAFDGFFNEGKGYPKFRSFKINWFSLFYDEPYKGYKVNGRNIVISLGKDSNNKQIKLTGILNEHLTLKESDKLKNFRICKEHKKYYGIFCIERNEIKKKEVKSWIAIDPNHKNFFVAINNKGESTEFRKLTQVKYFDKVIDQMKSKRDKCKKYSNKWKRVNKALDNVYHKRQEQTKQLCYTISNELAKQYDYVLMGDYTPTLEVASRVTMHRSMLNQSMIGKFRKILEHVMIRSGKHFLKVDEHNTTKECCICGQHQKKTPEIREFICTNCHRQLGRDINSCINIAKKSEILSGSDYVKWDLSQVTYTIEWDYIKCKISYSVGYAKQKAA